MSEPSVADKIVNGTLKTLGVSRDFSADVICTAAGGAAAFAASMWFSGQIATLINPFVWISAGIGAVVAAMLWKRNRRDNA